MTPRHGGTRIDQTIQEIATLSAQTLPAWLQADVNRLRGEFALVLHAEPASPATGVGERALRLLLEHLAAQDRRANCRRVVR